MRRNIGVTVIAAAALLSGSLVGNAYGSSDEITEPRIIELIHGDVSVADYPLRDTQGRRSATINVFRGPLLDTDGNEVGSHRCECINANAAKLGWACTHIMILKPGPHTERGTVVITGMFRGFSGESGAVTGGTGAYANARGYSTFTVQDGDFVATLYLTP